MLQFKMQITKIYENEPINRKYANNKFNATNTITRTRNQKLIDMDKYQKKTNQISKLISVPLFYSTIDYKTRKYIFICKE